jgi:hypothetical protein
MGLLFVGCGTITVDDGTETEENNTPSGQNISDTPPSETVDNIANDTNGSSRIIGRVTYDRIKVNSNGRGLDYNHIVQEPAKQVVVLAINNTNQAIASTTTDDNGEYSFTNLPKETKIKIRVYAKLKKTGIGGWDVKVVDNARGDAQYVLEGDLVSTGTSSTRRNLNASSGWGGRSYTGTRSAAPFAILGSVYQAITKVALADSSTSFPPLVINWSDRNVPTRGSLADGQIGTSHYNGTALYILGYANNDTDEYDDHIIIHEWGHYFEAQFSRADSTGGPHTSGDHLDIRLAFGEGWGNAWSAIATDDAVYYDTLFSGQADGWSMNIENQAKETPGYFSEASIQRILYDIYDSNNDGMDTLSMGFKPIYDVLTGAQKRTPAFTSIFSFIKNLKVENSTLSEEIDDVVSAESITTISDIYGSNQNTLYNDLVVGGSVSLCTSIQYNNPDPQKRVYNKLNNHKFVKFTIAQSGTYTITINQTNGGASDPDFALYKTNALGEALDKGISEVRNQEEKSLNLSAGDYMLDVIGYMNQQTSCYAITLN